MLCRAATPAPVERMSSTMCPVLPPSFQLAHGQHWLSTATSCGQRRYGPALARTLAVIDAAQRAGLTLDEIKTLLPAALDDASAVERLREVAPRVENGIQANHSGPAPTVIPT